MPKARRSEAAGTYQTTSFGVYESTDYEYHRHVFLSAPRGFQNRALIDERWDMVEAQRSTSPLPDWVDRLALAKGLTPSYDPAESGTESRVLLVLEAPGPMTNAENVRPGSGFISVDNDDPTADNLWRARAAASLDDGVMCWNIVPWYLGRAARKPTADEMRDGAGSLIELMRMLPKLDTVVLLGRYAQTGWKANIARSMRRPAVRVVPSWHPSPLSLNQPGRRDQLTAALELAAVANPSNEEHRYPHDH